MSPDQQPRRLGSPHHADDQSSPPANKSDGQPDKINWVQMSNYAELAIVFPAATVIGWLRKAPFLYSLGQKVRIRSVPAGLVFSVPLDPALTRWAN